jgi:ribosomal protein S18 acetylase RimI-like enzyme
MSVSLRPARENDVPAMAAIRAREWETEAYWTARIRRYLRGEHSPQQALAARAAFVATDRDAVVGFVSGHRTRRYGCDGELQWINVIEERRGHGIAGKLLQQMAAWFVKQGVLRVCVDVDPKNTAARHLYKKYGARPLKPYWMVWEDARQMGTQSTDIR